MKSYYGLFLFAAISLSPSYLAEGATNSGKNKVQSEEVKKVFIEVLDARINGDIPRFCSYLAKDVYNKHNGNKIENFCENINNDLMNRCKKAKLGLEEVINLNLIKIYTPKELLKIVGPQAESIYHLTGKEYAASVKTNMICTGDSLGAIFKREDGKWKISSWQE